MMSVWVLTEHDADENASEVIAVFSDMQPGLVAMKERHESCHHRELTWDEFDELVTHRGADGMEAWSVLDDGGEMEWRLQEWEIR